MATIRAFTDLEQSRKLAVILPLESADMHYKVMRSNNESNVSLIPYSSLGHYKNNDFQYCIPCWSLAALLGVIPDYTLQKIGKDVFVVYETGTAVIGTNDYDNPIDACVAMIGRLHELKML